MFNRYTAICHAISHKKVESPRILLVLKQNTFIILSQMWTDKKLRIFHICVHAVSAALVAPMAFYPAPFEIYNDGGTIYTWCDEKFVE